MIKEIFRSATFNPFKHLAEKNKHRSQEDVDNYTKETAKTIALEVLEWAKAKGVTSFTFWIHPQTSQNIEKHDSIYDLQYFYKGFQNFELAEKFTAMVLMKGEGDGSSFPNGGMRGTDKARAYIAWQAKSDMFIRETKNGKVLYIPGMLLTHYGEALDEKTYLLRAQKQLRNNTIRLMKCFGEDVKHVMFALGIEQQFFIVPKKDYEARLDLKQCGRTLYGRLPPKNQQFSDHYYGRIDSNILEILNEVELQLLKIGVPVKTKHKQVAINQYEISCSYENAVNAVDHNMILIDVLREIFDQKGYTVLLHQKPFAHANGSAKHCNWSIMVNSGEQLKNLYDPGLNPKQNKQFLLFILLTLKAVLNNAALLKASVTSPSNQHRMGGHEAPPCIISVFLGSYVDRLLNAVQKDQDFINEIKDLQSMIPGCISLLQDNTDRNRTSPFAFTGNKFEFRSVGSKQNASFSMTVVAAMMAKEIKEAAQQLQKGTDINVLIQSLIKQTKMIRFQKNGYSKQWQKQASERRLPNLKTALQAFSSVKNAQMLKELNIFSDKQLNAKYNILMTNYVITKTAQASCLQIILKQNFLPRILSQIKTFTDIGKDSILSKLQIPRFQKMYIDLFDAAQKLSQFDKIINNSQQIQDQVSKATQLKDYIETISQQLSTIQIQLPTNKHVPQLFEFLNKYQ